MTKEKNLRAHELREGQYFSYIGSFKVYEIISQPIPCEEAKVIMHVHDGNRSMKCRLNREAVCKIHESFADTPIGK